MTGGIDWPALMRAGIGGLGLAPELFWRLTPGELMLMLGRGVEPKAPMGRSGLDDLMARFPDRTGE